METQIQIKIDHGDKKKIVRAAKKIGLGHSTFCKTVALQEANKILREAQDE